MSHSSPLDTSAAYLNAVDLSQVNLDQLNQEMSSHLIKDEEISFEEDILEDELLCEVPVNDNEEEKIEEFCKMDGFEVKEEKFEDECEIFLKSPNPPRVFANSSFPTNSPRVSLNSKLCSTSSPRNSTNTPQNSPKIVTIHSANGEQFKITELDENSLADYSLPSIKQEYDDNQYQDLEAPQLHHESPLLDVKQEEEINLMDMPSTCFLEHIILTDGLKKFNQLPKISDEASKSLKKLSEKLEKQEKSLDQPRKPVHTIAFDLEPSINMPAVVMKNFHMEKHAVNLRREIGNKVFVYNILYYICSSCLTVFVTEKSFAKHLEAVHTMFLKCWMCSNKYVHWAELKSHVKGHSEDLTTGCEPAAPRQPLHRVLTKRPNTQFKRIASLELPVNAPSSPNTKPPETTTNKSLVAVPSNMSFLERHILLDALKKLGTSINFSPSCSKHLRDTSKTLEKAMSHAPVQTGKVQRIVRSLVFEETPVQLPVTSQKSYNIEKFTTGAEKRLGSRIYVHMVPYYVCKACMTVCLTQDNLFDHHKDQHATTSIPFSCWLCPRKYSTWGLFKSHVNSHDNTKPYSCKYCSTLFRLKVSLKEHLKSCGRSCDVCGRRFVDLKELQEHEKVHEGKWKITTMGGVPIQEVKCMFCTQKFLREEELEAHYKTHQSNVSMKCPSCSRCILVHPQNILKDRKTREFRCVTCLNLSRRTQPAESPKTQPNSSPGQPKRPPTAAAAPPKKLKMAETPPQSTEDSTVTCYVCAATFSSNIKLFWHMKKHLERREFKCPVCLRDFKERDAMIKHCKVDHARDTMIHCKLCDRKYHFVDMEVHMKVHELREFEDRDDWDGVLEKTIKVPRDEGTKSLVRKIQKGRAGSSGQD